MKHPLILILLLAFCYSVSHAQNAGSINASFVDEQNKPIDGLFVQLMNAKDSSLALSEFTDAKGNVQFSNVKHGGYFLYVGQFLYQEYRSGIITVAKEQVSLPQVMLKVKALKEVTVTAQVPFVERQPDMTVVNVDKSPMSAGSSTMDVLERSPGVVVDQNDDINLQGKAGVTIMINGKKVEMSGSDLADFLRSMPADAIEKIELITNPGAKYDAAGTGGIINIVLKKGKLLGFNGTVFGGYSQGVYPKSSDGFTLNDRTKKFNLFLNYTFSYRKNLKNVSMNQNFYNGNELTESTIQNSYYVVNNNFNTIHAGADFYATDKTTIGFVADGFLRRYMYNESTNSFTDSVGIPASYSNSTASDNGYEDQYSLELNCKHNYDSAGKKTLSMSADYGSYGFHDMQQFFNTYSIIGNPYVQPPVVYGVVPSTTQLYTFQADYSTYLNSKSKFEAGVKENYVSEDADNMFYLGSTTQAPVDTNQTQHFLYYQNIAAGYATYYIMFARSSVSLGLRAEQTNTRGDLITYNDKINQSYLYWFPHITYADTLDKNNSLNLSAGTRFNRPDYDELDPFKNYINPTTYSVGNPNLLPEYEYNVSASEVFKNEYTLTLSYAFTQNPEETVHIPVPGQDGVTEIIDENLELKNYYGLSISVSPQVNKWWTSNTYASVYYNQYMANVSQTPLNGGKLIFQGNTDNIFNLGRRFTFEVNGQYSSGGYWGYFQSSQRWAAGAGLMAKMMKDKLALKLSISDIFYTNYLSTTSEVTNYTESYIVKRDTRVAGISLTYKFGRNYEPEKEKTQKMDTGSDKATTGL